MNHAGVAASRTGRKQGVRMKITPPADDYGLQKLKQANSRSEVKETAKVEPYPRIAPSEERREPRHPVEWEMRRQQRRKCERRLFKGNSLLNTRDSHERRLGSRRQNDYTSPAADGPSVGHGIDDFV